jgi:hypothetical protein
MFGVLGCGLGWVKSEGGEDEAQGDSREREEEGEERGHWCVVVWFG